MNAHAPTRTHRIGQRIRQARAGRGLSTAALAKRTFSRVTKSRIENYEQGIRRPDLETAETLAAALGVSPCWLLCMPCCDGADQPAEPNAA